MADDKSTRQVELNSVLEKLETERKAYLDKLEYLDKLISIIKKDIESPSIEEVRELIYRCESLMSENVRLRMQCSSLRNKLSNKKTKRKPRNTASKPKKRLSPEEEIEIKLEITKLSNECDMLGAEIFYGISHDTLNYDYIENLLNILKQKKYDIEQLKKKLGQEDK